MSTIPKLNLTGEVTINKLISDLIVESDNTKIITKPQADERYASSGTVVGEVYDWKPAQDQKIQFSLNSYSDTFVVPMNGWVVFNPESKHRPEQWAVKVNGREVLTSNADGDIVGQFPVSAGDEITSTAADKLFEDDNFNDRVAYFMPCQSELKDWREESLKKSYDIWKDAVVNNGSTTTVQDQYLEPDLTWVMAVGEDGIRNSLHKINLNEGVDSRGNHLFYIQTENVNPKVGLFPSSHFPNLAGFVGDLSSLTDGYQMFLGGMNGNSMFAEFYTNSLSSMTTAVSMFEYTPIHSFLCDMPNLTNGTQMFCHCDDLLEFRSDTPALTDGTKMFYECLSLDTFSGDLSALENGSWMFRYCESLSSFNLDSPNLTNANIMFDHCKNLSVFYGNLSSLTNGLGMFNYCYALSEFWCELPNLTDGTYMFMFCKLDGPSVKRILDSIPSYNDNEMRYLYLGMSDEGKQMFTSITGSSAANNSQVSYKGWTFYII